MKKIAMRVMFIPFLAVLLVAGGCNSQQAAQNFSNVIVGILNVAQAEEPVLSAKDAAIITPWIALGQTLDAQLNACISGAGASGKKAAFVGCFNNFASGLLNPTELAQLKVLDSGSQSKVQLWATAVIIGVNAALTNFGGTAQPMPTIAAPPTTAQLDGLRYELVREGYAL